MEIRIDTKKDSHDDIKKMISFLQKFVEESSNYGSYESYGSSSSNSNNDDFNIPSTSMFDSPAPEPKNESKDEDSFTIIEY